MGRAKKRNGRSGFTLLETAAAMTLSVIVLATTALTLQAITLGPTQMNNQAKARQQGELMLRKIGAELASAKIITSARDEDGNQRIEFTIPENLTGQNRGDTNQKIEYPPASSPKIYLDGPVPVQYLQICKYTWAGPETPLRFSHVNPQLTGIDQGYVYNASDPWNGRESVYIPSCSLFRLRYECEVRYEGIGAASCPTEVILTATDSQRENLYNHYVISNASCPQATMTIYVRAVHVELAVPYENQVYTFRRTVLCHEKPQLAAYWDREPT